MSLRLDLYYQHQNAIDALMNTTRLPIVSNLRTKPMYLSELARAANIDNATAYHHLEILEKVNLVTSELKMQEDPRLKGRSGRFYTLNKERYSELCQIILTILTPLENQQM